jgi:steroid delta-isomerase-like uncharacterized protein
MVFIAVGLALVLSGCKKKEAAPEKEPEKAPEKAPEKKPPETRPEPRKPPADKMAVLKAGFAAFNAGKIDDSVKEFPENVTWIVADGGPMGMFRGKAKVKGYFQSVRKSFPDLKVIPERIFDGGNVVIVQAIFTGTQKGPYMGKPASNKKVGLPGLYWFYWSGGKYVKVISYLDVPATMVQLGLMKPMKGMPAPVVLAAPTKAPEFIKGPRNKKLEALYAKLIAMKSGDKALAAAFAKDVKLRGANGAPLKGFKAYKKILAAGEKSYPDLQSRVLEAVAIGNWLVGRIAQTGTNKGKIGKMKPTGKKVSWTMCHVGKVQGGKFVEGYGYQNAMGALIQLGVIPMPGAKPPAKGGKPPAKGAKPPKKGK